MELDLRQLMRIARRWGWLVVLVMLTTGAAAYVTSSRQTDMYAASTTLLVSSGQGPSANDYSALQATRGLASTYRLLIETRPVMTSVIDALDLPFTATELDAKVSTSVVQDTQLITIRVEDPDPEQAADIANEIAAQFQTQVREQTSNKVSASRASLDEQIDQLETQRASVEEQIEELDTTANADDQSIQRQINALVQERSRIDETISEVRLEALSVDADVSAGSATVEIVEPAEAPGSPFAPQVLRNAVLGLFVGLLLGVGLVALLEYLDNTVKPELDIQEMAGAPILSVVPLADNVRPGANQVFTMAQPASSAAEALRLLRTNLDFAAATNPITTLSISSPGPGEGKSTMAANLAVVMAQAGFETVLIDADLRKPTQHRIFGVQNSAGLTTLLTHPETDWRTVAARVALPGLSLISSGPLPPNPADLLQSSRFSEVLNRLKQDADFVLIDSAPVLAVSDPLTVATRADGMILVSKVGQTRIDALRAAARSVHQGNIRLVGVVLNQLKDKRAVGYYYGDYYGSEQTKPQPLAGPTPHTPQATHSPETVDRPKAEPANS